MKSQIINLGSNDAFAVYRLPYEANYHLVRQYSTDRQSFKSRSKEGVGFVFHPFVASEKYPSVLIKAEKTYLNPRFSFQSFFQNTTVNLDQYDYLDLADRFIYETQTRFKKLILSRIQSFDFPTGNLYHLFLALKDTYKNAFVYLVNIPNIGCWMGASPEIFLTQKGKIAKTVALAGTQKDWGIDLEMVRWGGKEIEEQAMVERYVEEVLKEKVIPYRKRGPETVKAGNILHLKSTFQMKLGNKFHDLAQAIHPTPAICGIPKEQAKQFIETFEPHDRAYYCGFLGPYGIESQTNLFVNLRCMQVFQSQFSLYIGGGITAESVAEKEWKETEMKAQTLLDVIEKVYEGSMEFA